MFIYDMTIGDSFNFNHDKNTYTLMLDGFNIYLKWLIIIYYFSWLENIIVDGIVWSEE